MLGPYQPQFRLYTHMTNEYFYAASSRKIHGWYYRALIAARFLSPRLTPYPLVILYILILHYEICNFALE